MPEYDRFASRVFALAAIGLIAWGGFLLVQPFIAPILWAALLALLVYPITAPLTRRLGGGRGRVALLLTLAAVLVVVIPAVLVVGIFVAQAGELVRRLQTSAGAYHLQRPADVLAIPVVNSAVTWLSARVPITLEQVQAAAVQGGQRVIERMLALGGSLFTGVVNQVVNVLLALVLFYFFVRDGEEIASRGLRLVPLDERRKQQLAEQLIGVARGVMLGSLATAVAQGTLVGVSFAIAGLSSPVVFAVVAMVASLVPLVGAALIWVPAVLYLAIQGAWGTMTFVLVWSVAVVSTIDNVIRPMFVSSRANLSTLPMFIGLFGGVAAFGPVGMFVGPAVVVLVLALARFAEEAIDRDTVAV